MKKPSPEELDDALLGDVSGGTFGELEVCPRCGNPLTANNLCTVCNVLIPISPRENVGNRGLSLADE